MKKKIFIHTNNKQGIGAKLSKFSFERALRGKDVEVEYINVDNLDVFKEFSGKRYLHRRFPNGVVYNPEDLQSFTLSRFMAPELMGYQGRAIVVDPDIFAIKDIDLLLSMDLEGRAIAACSKHGAWDSSMMLMDCEKLKHWKIERILKDLEEEKVEYVEQMSLETEDSSTIKEVPRVWNHLDTLTPDTNMVHMTVRLTQPWRTGLPIDFTINPMPKIFGIIPREPIHKLLGKYPTHYQRHPDKEIEVWFFNLVRDALESGFISRSEIEEEINKGHVRKDLLEKVSA